MFKAIRTLAIFAVFAFVTNAQAACTMLDERVCQIDALLQSATGHKVQYSVDFTTRVAEYEWALGQPDVIHLGDTRQLDDDSLYFALAHEFGHSVMRHGRQYVEHFAADADKSMSDVELVHKYIESVQNSDAPEELNYSQEYQADAFAARILAADGLDVSNAMRHLLKNAASDATHPGRRDRIAKAKEVVAEFQAEMAAVTAGLIELQAQNEKTQTVAQPEQTASL